ncbi:MAG TPA: right-handed parallel beta-helix repeat-containing protein, partial [Kofleriaceae bacterium]
IAGGNLSTQTWTVANSPYTVQGDITVIAGATLTIDPGVVVQAASSSDSQVAGRNTSRVEITVNGSLVVNGTAQSPVTFKSTSTSAGTWYGIIATSTATQLDMHYANIESSTYGVTAEATGTQVTLANVTASSASSYGFWLRAGSPALNAVNAISSGSYGIYVTDTANPVITGSTVRNSGSIGLYVTHNTPGHSVTVTNCTFHANGSYGMYSTSGSGNGATITVKNSIVTGSAYGLYRNDSATWSVTYSNVWNNTSNNYSGVSPGTNTISANPLYVSATDLRLTSNSPSRFGGDNNADQGSQPYDNVATPGLYGVLWSNTTLLATTGSYTAAGDLTVPAGVTLTIEPGVTLSFASSSDIMLAGQNTSRGELVVKGALVANGTSTNPITIGSTSTSAGTWYGVELDTTAHDSVLDDVTIRYATYGIEYRSTGTGNQLSNLTVDSASSYGFWLRAGSPSLDLVSAISSGSYGYYITDTSSPTFTRCIARNSGSIGMYITHNTPGHSVSLTRCTLHANGSYGVYSTSGSGNGATITIVGSIITGSAYGVYRNDSATWSVTNSNVWNNTSNNYSGVSPGSGTLSANPLYVSATDLRLTSNSPSRFGAPGNLDQGALPYDNVATPGLYGVLWTNTTLTASGGPYTAAGDLTVGPNTTLTIEPGATLSFTSSSDVMLAGQNPSRGELTVLGTLVADGTPQSPITLSSTSTSAGTWYGLDLDASAHATVLDNVIVRYATYGLIYRSTGTGNVMKHITVESASSYGAWLRQGSPAIDALFSISSGSYGVYITDAASPTLTNCVVRNSGSIGVYVTHNTPGRSVAITNCTLNANGSYGIYSTSGSGNGATINVSNSIITNAAYGCYRNDSATWSVTYSDVWNNTSNNYSGVTAGTGTISSNPQFTSTVDLHIASTSVAVDAGTNGPSSDADGVARPLDGNGVGGAQWDMGAYEFVLTAQCGNGAKEMNETCDDGANNGMYGYCNSSCSGMGPRCGDGAQNGPEQCDDGNTSNLDECLNTCTNPSCGDGYVRVNVEACDDGNQSNTDACLTTCAAASCGDGFVRAGVEPCDDGNQSNTDACLTTCVVASCGDGYAQAGVEDCDDGNMANTDACLNICKAASCGDGFTEAGVEGCDDGNTVETDTCTTMCVSTSCGDGVVQADVEQCDDGNKIDSDACRSNCVTARCGDGAIQFGVEECDDGNSDPGDGCDELCIVEDDEMPPGTPRGGGGCCETSRSGGSSGFLLALGVFFVLRRRRRR